MLQLALALAVAAPLAQDAPAGEPAPPKDYIADAKLAANAPVVVTLTALGHIAILDARTGAAHADSKAKLVVPSPRALAISPDGETLAVLGTGTRVHLFRWATNEQPKIIDLLPDDPDTTTERTHSTRMDFGPANRRLIVSTEATGAVLLDIEGKEIMRPVPCGGSWFRAPWDWSDDGKLLACISQKGIVMVDPIAGTKHEATIGFGKYRPTCIDVSSDGQLIAIGTRGHAVVVLDKGGKQLWRSVAKFPNDPFLDMRADDDGHVASVAFSPSGEMVAVTTAKSTAAALFRTADGEQIAEGQFCGGRMGEPRMISWSADSNRVYHSFASGALRAMVMQIKREDGAAVGASEMPVDEDIEHSTVPARGWLNHGLQKSPSTIRLIEMSSGKVGWTLARE